MPSKTLKSNPVMESGISSFDSSRRSRSWTLIENGYATLLLGEEGKIDGGYFLDDNQPVFFHVDGSRGLSSGPIDFLGMIGGKTSWTAEDGLALEYDSDLVGSGGFNDDRDRDRDRDRERDRDRDVAVLGLKGLADGVDFLGFNNILGLNPTKIGYNFVLINGKDYISGFVQCMGQDRPTVKLVKGLEMIFTHLILGPPKVKPKKLKIPGILGGSGPVSILTKTRLNLNASSVPRPLVSLEATRIPVLLSYSSTDGDLELYVPTFNAWVVRPPLAVNFSHYVMVSHNYRDCEILLLSRRSRREIIVYRGLDNTVVNLPYIQHFCRRHGLYHISGRFQKVGLGGGQSDYRVFVIAFYWINHQGGNLIRLYYRQPLQQVWNRTEYFLAPPMQRPEAFSVIGEVFAWVDLASGRVFTIQNWDIDPAEGPPVLGPAIVAPAEIAGAICVLGVEEEERTCLVVFRNHRVRVYEISIFSVPLPGVYNFGPRVNLSYRNFYCTVSGVGFSAAPPHLGAGPINAIFVGGFIGDCSRLHYYAEIVAQQNAGLQAVDVDFQCLRHCHDPAVAARPLKCLCQSAFLLLPLHLVALMIPALVPFLR